MLLDRVTVIYFLERHPRHGPIARQVFERVEAGNITVLVSSLIFVELLVPLYRIGDLQAGGILTNDKGMSRLVNERLSVWLFDGCFSV